MSTTFHPTGPLSIGNAINAALRLYKDHFKIYWPIALEAGFWSLLPTIVDLLLTYTIFKNTESNTVLRPIILPLQIFCAARFLALSAVIARLAFKQLMYSPETPVEAKAPVLKKMWQFLLIQIFVFFLIFFAVLVLGFFAAFIVAISPILPVLSVILLLFFIVSIIILLTIIYARFSIPEVCLAVEENMTATAAMGRSWKLTKNFAWRIVAIVSLAFMITIPVYILASVPLWLAVLPFLAESATTNEMNLETSSMQGVVLSILIFSALNILAIPFWQAIKGVIYYDLRNRKEGLQLNVN